MDYRAFWLPKNGSTPEEYEDALAADPQLGRFAVADGATESVFAGQWARLLVDQFVAAFESESGKTTSWLLRVWDLWSVSLRGQDLKWYAQEKLRTEGANATFLGLWFDDCSEQSGRWRALAVGDTCLFHTRKDELIEAFPLTQSEQFGNQPPLISSRLSPEVIEEQRVKWAEGQLESRDRLWLMTDALAHWCLAEHEAERNPWDSLEGWLEPAATNAGFSTWVEGLRDAGQLRNDDVTLLVVSV